MEFFRKAIIGLAILAMMGCAHKKVIDHELDDAYLVPVDKLVMEPCKPIIVLNSAVDFRAVLTNKIDNDVQYKDCVGKNNALRQILESLEDEQVIRFTTPKSP